MGRELEHEMSEQEKSPETMALGDAFLEKAFREVAEDEGSDEIMEAQLEFGKEDLAVLTENLAELQDALRLYVVVPVAERAKKLLFDDETRKVAFHRLFIFGMFCSGIMGQQTDSTEMTRALASITPMIDNILSYFYELNNGAGQMEIYHEGDNAEVKRARLKFFMSARVYEAIDHTVPQAIDKILVTLKNTNNLGDNWKAEHAAR